MAVTRVAEQAREFEEVLAADGAQVIVQPLIRIEAPAQLEPLRAAIVRIREYDWLVFTSANAVRRFMHEFGAAGVAREQLSMLQVAAVGPATASALKERGIDVDLFPGEYVATAIATAMSAKSDLTGVRVLWPRASEARPDLALALERRGARVDAVEAYSTILDRDAGRRLRQQVEEGRVDVLTFTSPSTVRVFAEAGGAVPAGVHVAVIGPVTAAAARRYHLPVHIEPAENTVAGLVEAMRAYFATPGE